MKDTKKNILLILMSVSLVILLGITVWDFATEAQQKESVFKTADGTVVKIFRDENQIFKDDSQTQELVIEGESDEEIYYGAIIHRNGSTERVYAIADDGSFITEVIESGSGE